MPKPALTRKIQQGTPQHYLQDILRRRNRAILPGVGLNRTGIAIVGGGCSGVLAAVQLLKAGFAGEVTVLEPRATLGPGLAYSTEFDQHLLNVPAGKMSALPQEPSHFLDWLRSRDWPSAAPDAFVPRKLYGAYLETLLRDELRISGAGHFSSIRGEVVEIQSRAEGAQLALGNGTFVEAAKVVLALGNPASGPALRSLVNSGHSWHPSPWLGDALKLSFHDQKILLVGTGLTAVDSALALLSQNASCSVFMISRRGLVPQTHSMRHVPASQPPLIRAQGLRMLFREMRAQIGAARDLNLCWRTVVDSLRPVSNSIWADLSDGDKRKFLRHLRTYWEIHRHRMAPEISARLQGFRDSGRLEVLAGRVLNSESRGGVVRVDVALRTGEQRRLEVDRVINCTGIHEDYRDSPRQLVRSLVASGQATANSLGLGFRTDEHGALIDQHGEVSTVLFTLGPPRRGDLFETTAVPEIRVQAAALAARLTSACRELATR